MIKVGILSDTHDLLRPEVVQRLRGCSCILHGGDVSSQRILDQLEQLAPVKVVRGNNDREWAERLPLTLDFELEGLRISMAHKKKDLPREGRSVPCLPTSISTSMTMRWKAGASM